MIQRSLNHHLRRKEKIRGQALVVVLILAVVSITLFTAATISVLSASEGALMQTRSQTALLMAESGAEETVLRLLRDPTYTGSTVTIGTDSYVVIVSSPTPPTVTIQSVGTSTGVSKTITLVGQLQKGVFTRTSRTVQ